MEDATAVLQAHEAYPSRNKANQLIRMNYDTPRKPSFDLCFFNFKRTLEELGEMLENHGFKDDVKQMSSRELFSRPLLYSLTRHIVQLTERDRRKTQSTLSDARILQQRSG